MFVRVVLPGTAVPLATHEGRPSVPEGISRARKDRIKRTGDGKNRTVTTICHACAFLLRKVVRAFLFFLSHRHLDSSSSSRGTQETPGSLRGSRTRWDRSFFQQNPVSRRKNRRKCASR
ncbi:hypothetical protein PUN28_018059 [Cardiocondyla obscurior]|uniref:Secreted protein n=1 Tax=Cardiocondyla obscurior TaxID=286306 RepID=A0AAW2EKY8_9HYME